MQGGITAREIVDRIRDHLGVVWNAGGADGFSAGSPDTVVTGIATSFAPSLEVLSRAAAEGRNPPTTLAQAAADVARNLESASVRVVGDPELQVSRIARGSHTLAGNMEALRDVDAILVSEAREWESIEYLRDTILSGQRKGMILIAHERGEEAGMDECARWLRTFIHEAPVAFIDSREPFWIPS